MMIPPPTPKSALKTPAARPIASSRSIEASLATPVERPRRLCRLGRFTRSMESCASKSASVGDSYRMVVRVEALLAPLVESPGEAAILLDVDGTLAPIVARPELASVPEETREELRRLTGRYALVGCISGRTGEDAARVVGVDGPVYVGVHGLELAPEAERWRGPLREFAESVDWPVEDKGLAVVFHYRGAVDEEAALGALRGVADRATALGLRAQFGRKVLEVRPPVAADKGTAVRALLEQRRLRRALYAGDDTTD